MLAAGRALRRILDTLYLAGGVVAAGAARRMACIEDPAGGGTTKNLPMAKQTIDILGMIEEKTQGNLSTDEASMLKHILYELRMIYVKEKG